MLPQQLSDSDILLTPSNSWMRFASIAIVTLALLASTGCKKEIDTSRLIGTWDMVIPNLVDELPEPPNEELRAIVQQIASEHASSLETSMSFDPNGTLTVVFGAERRVGTWRPVEGRGARLTIESTLPDENGENSSATDNIRFEDDDTLVITSEEGSAITFRRAREGS